MHGTILNPGDIWTSAPLLSGHPPPVTHLWSHTLGVSPTDYETVGENVGGGEMISPDSLCNSNFVSYLALLDK